MLKKLLVYKKRKFLLVCTSFVLIIGIFLNSSSVIQGNPSGYLDKVVTYEVERTGDTAKLADLYVGVDLDKVMKSIEIRIPKNVDIANFDTLILPNGWSKFRNSNITVDSENDYQSITFAMNDYNGQKTNDRVSIKKFLEELNFNINAPVDKKGTIEVVLHELVYTSWEDPEGGKHYYTYVPTVGSWFTAYNSAKKMKYRGLTGYLATLTSLEEHDFVYNNIAKHSGWLGGSRMVYKSNNKKINDETSIPTVASSYNLAIAQAKEWYWVNGPETGKVFFTKPTYSAGGKAPIGVYQGFNNPLAGGTVQEPNNAGNSEAALEFAQASAGNQTKLWNDLSPTNTNYQSGYYVEFSQYGSQTETEEETDVSYKQDIPQKIVYTGVDADGKLLSFGNMIIDQQIRISDSTRTVTPNQDEMYDFVNFVDSTGTVLTNEFLIKNEQQNINAVYAIRKLTINSRQVIVDENNQITVPDSGFSSLSSYTTTNQLQDQFMLKMPSSSNVNQTFEKRIIRYKIDEPIFKIKTQVPEYYDLVGYVVTTENAGHTVASSIKEPMQLDVTQSVNYWITVYIKPTTNLPTLYQWNYKSNNLGTIKQ